MKFVFLTLTIIAFVFALVVDNIILTQEPENPVISLSMNWMTVFILHTPAIGFAVLCMVEYWEEDARSFRQKAIAEAEAAVESTTGSIFTRK